MRTGGADFFSCFACGVGFLPYIWKKWHETIERVVGGVFAFVVPAVVRGVRRAFGAGGGGDVRAVSGVDALLAAGAREAGAAVGRDYARGGDLCVVCV